MPTGIGTALLLALAGATAAAWLGALLRTRGVRPVRALAAFFGRQPKAGRVLLAALLAGLWIVAGAKPGGPRPRADGAGTADARIPPAARALAEEDFRRGFVLARAGTGEAFGFAAPSNAAVCADWEAFGAAEDWTYLALDNWAATLGTNEVNRFRVYSFGKVQPCVANEAGSLAANRWFAPFRTSLGIVPQANWGRLPASARPSRFWHLLTPSNTLQLTWQNALFGRRASAPLSFQCRLKR